MLNPKLKEVYSVQAIPTLEIMSDYLEERNITAYVYNEHTWEGVTYPDTIVFDVPKLDSSIRRLLHKACELYLGLFDEDDEEYYYPIWAREYSSNWEKYIKDENVMIPLWIK